MTFVYREPAKIVRDILVRELEIRDSQAMALYQKFPIPTNGLYLNVSYVGPGKVISALDEWADDGAGGLVETQSVVMLHLLQIDMMSYDNTARQRKEEIVLALRSLFSQSQQEQYNMQIARQPGAFLDTSFQEETKFVQRFTTTILATSVQIKQKAVADFYTDFTRAVPPQLAAKNANE